MPDQRALSSQRVYVIYECKHGWCIEPARVADSGSIYAYTERRHVWAFSRITQAVWWLVRHVNGGTNGRQDSAPSEAAAGGKRETSEPGSSAAPSVALRPDRNGAFEEDAIEARQA